MLPRGRRTLEIGNDPVPVGIAFSEAPDELPCNPGATAASAGEELERLDAPDNVGAERLWEPLNRLGALRRAGSVDVWGAVGRVGAVGGAGSEGGSGAAERVGVEGSSNPEAELSPATTATDATNIATAIRRTLPWGTMRSLARQTSEQE